MHRLISLVLVCVGLTALDYAVYRLYGVWLTAAFAVIGVLFVQERFGSERDDESSGD